MTVYSVTLFGSHPSLDNDDCWTGADFETEAEARAVFDNPFAYFENRGKRPLPGYYCSDTEYVALDGPGISEIRKNPKFDRAEKIREQEAEDRAWQRERAMEAGMCMGIDAYNDEMGY